MNNPRTKCGIALFCVALTGLADPLAAAEPASTQPSAPIAEVVQETPVNAWGKASETLQEAAYLVSPMATWSGDHGAIGAMAWAPVFETARQLLFAEATGLKGEQSLGVVSAGLGFRRVLGESLGFAGLNAFYDGLQDADDFSYSQLGLGMEWGNGRWFSNANAYFPVGDAKDFHHDFKRTPAGYACEASQWAEVEAGLWLLKKPRLLDPYIAVGYFGTWNGVDNTNGIKLRAEVAVAKWIYAGAEWRQNGGPGVGQEWTLGLRFQFAFGKSGGAGTEDVHGQRTNRPGSYYGHVRRSAWPSINGCDRRPPCGCSGSSNLIFP